MLDLSQIQPVDRVVEITNPATGENIGLRITLMSIDDPRMQKVKRRITDERQRLEQRNKFFKAEELEQNRNVILFTAMTGWEWYNPTGKEGDKNYNADAMPSFDGDVLDFNRKNVDMMLTKLTWFADQVNEALGDARAFFTN